MESEKTLEMIEKAIRKLMEEEDINAKSPSIDESFVAVDKEDENEKAGGRHHQQELLSRLLSQLDALEEGNSDTGESKLKAHVEDAVSSEIGENTNTTTTNTTPNEVNAEIIKELKNVQRQNMITHGLLTAMIVLTLGWQLSEVSLILKIKDGLSNPFRSIGGLIKGFLKSRTEVNVQDMMKPASERQKQVMEPTSLPGLKIPELPHLELPCFDTSDEE